MCCNVFNDASVQRVQWYQCPKLCIRDQTQLTKSSKSYQSPIEKFFRGHYNWPKTWNLQTLFKMHMLKKFAYPKVYNDLGQSLPCIWRRKQPQLPIFYLTTVVRNWQMSLGGVRGPNNKCEVQIIENTFHFPPGSGQVSSQMPVRW